MLNVGTMYKTRNGSKAFVIWKRNVRAEGKDVFYAVLTKDDTESTPLSYFSNGQLYTWSTLNFSKHDLDIML